MCGSAWTVVAVKALRPQRFEDALNAIRAYGWLDYTIYTDGSILPGVNYCGCSVEFTWGDLDDRHSISLPLAGLLCLII